MKIFLLFISALGLVACVMITMPVPTAATQAEVIGSGCAALSIPSLKPVPDVPVISPEIAKDRGRTEDILVAKIKELRNYGKVAHQTLEDLRDAQRKNCH